LNFTSVDPTPVSLVHNSIAKLQSEDADGEIKHEVKVINLKADLTLLDPLANYTVTWKNPANVIISNDLEVIVPVTGNSVYGYYTFTITLASGCIITKTIQVQAPDYVPD
jgi:hypothetical protein